MNALEHQAFNEYRKSLLRLNEEQLKALYRTEDLYNYNKVYVEYSDVIDRVIELEEIRWQQTYMYSRLVEEENQDPENISIRDFMIKANNIRELVSMLISKHKLDPIYSEIRWPEKHFQHIKFTIDEGFTHHHKLLILRAVILSTTANIREYEIKIKDEQTKRIKNITKLAVIAKTKNTLEHKLRILNHELTNINKKIEEEQHTQHGLGSMLSTIKSLHNRISDLEILGS